jgi:hypothetical protein
MDVGEANIFMHTVTAAMDVYCQNAVAEQNY